MQQAVYFNNTPFKVSVNGVMVLPGCCEKFDVDDATVIRMVESGLLSSEKIEQSLTDHAINYEYKQESKEHDDGISAAAESSEIRFAGQAIYEGLPRVEPFNRRSGNKRPSDCMGGY